ncbi:MAG: hypothetical protein JSV86_02505 [Gemmatimonadota bacterium]|nr:MAG: hypothetical protein JSV86_02505 [Gemmatimonadota bacterium]
MKRPLRRLFAYIPGLILTLILVLPAAARAQEIDADSIVVIERGTPSVDGWDVAEFPFKVITAPLYLLVLGLEQASQVADDTRLLRWIGYVNQELNRRSVYPTVAALGTGSGTGVALLLGQPSIDRAAWAHVRGGVTFKGYWRFLVRAGYGPEALVPGQPQNFAANAVGSMNHRHQDEFSGIGHDSREEDRSDYELDQQLVGAELGLAATRSTVLRLSSDWSEVETAPGNNARLPDVDSIFEPEEVPRFGATDRYISVGGHAEWFTRDPGLLPGRRWLRLGLRWNESASEGAADFAEIEASVGAVIPFHHDTRSLALEIGYQTARPSGEGEIPFYRLARLGGTPSAPAYRTGRFRDRDLILGRVEYSYRIWLGPRETSLLAASIFLHGGMVAHNLADDFTFGRLRPSLGIALSTITLTGSGARLEFAGGDEGLRVNFTFLAGY